MEKNEQEAPYTLLPAVFARFQDTVHCQMPHQPDSTFPQVPVALPEQSFQPAHISECQEIGVEWGEPAQPGE